jgi:hypothetical protein
MVAVFTVYFEDPFWVGALESEDSGALIVSRHVFGSEPSNAELLRFMLDDFAAMPRGRADGGEALAPRAPVGFKRAQREARRALSRPPSTKAQAALSAAREESKAGREELRREERLASAERLFALKSEKRRKKRAGH